MKREERIKIQRKQRRLARTRKKVLENKDRVRLTVFRSNKHIYAQLIDDVKGVTLLSAHENEVGEGAKTKISKAEQVGALIAQKAKKKKIGNVVFDKGSYRFHGRVKALAEAARKEGLQF